MGADRLEILFQDEHYVAIEKPPGLLVHRTPLSRDKTFALQSLRDQLGHRIYTIHRLDRATSGVLVFALSSEAARELGLMFMARQVEKRYLAVVRGFTPLEGCIDRPLAEEKDGPAQSALTCYRRVATVELDSPVVPYPTARYSLVDVRPETGRMHQIRRHFNHIAHPVVGDVAHGDRHHNHFFQDHFGIHRLLLFATELSFRHPYHQTPVTIRAPLGEQARGLFERLGWSTHDGNTISNRKVQATG